jgi:hypothetical protein
LGTKDSEKPVAVTFTISGALIELCAFVTVTVADAPLVTGAVGEAERFTVPVFPVKLAGDAETPSGRPLIVTATGPL